MPAVDQLCSCLVSRPIIASPTPQPDKYNTCHDPAAVLARLYRAHASYRRIAGPAGCKPRAMQPDPIMAFAPMRLRVAKTATHVICHDAQPPGCLLLW